MQGTFATMLSTSKRLSEFFFKNNGKINFVNAVRSMSTGDSSAAERKVQVDGVNINYVKNGAGEHPVLLLPGALGSIWTDFKPQVEKLNKEKLTVIAWDPPGYGKSRPPDRTFPEDFFQKDASWACKFMKTLGYKKFSLIGWSDGGITSLILASRYPESVRKMIVFGANSYIAPKEVEIYESIRDINKWSERMRAPMIELYGEEYFKKTWNGWIDGMKLIYHKNDGDICKNDLPNITCPTLIIHGKKDPMVLPEHPEFLKLNISNSRLEIFESGAHNLHLRFADEFNKTVENFLTE